MDTRHMVIPTSKMTLRIAHAHLASILSFRHACIPKVWWNHIILKQIFFEIFDQNCIVMSK